jgi:hypothetical protein
MSAPSETPVAERQILLVGPYGVLGTGVIDAVAENPQWGITTAARRSDRSPIFHATRISTAPRGMRRPQ